MSDSADNTDTYAAASQIIPNVQSPEYGQYTTDLPIMAIIILAVTGAIVGTYLGWKIYKLIWRRKHQTLPFLTSSDKTEYKPVPPGWSSGSYLLANSDVNLPKRSFTGSHSPSYGGDDSDLGSPISPGEGLLPPPPPHRGSSSSRQGLAAALNSVSSSASRQSLAAPDRRRFSSVPSSSSAASITGLNPSRSPRLSGAPHSPFSRIEIVPPQPLGAPPGSVVAADRSTLAFSTRSGVSGDGPADDSDKLFDPDQVMRRDQEREQKQKEFAQARAAYLSAAPSSGANNASPQQAEGSQTSSNYSGGPFRDSAEYDRSSYYHRPASNEIRSMSPTDAETYFAAEQDARRRPTSPEARAFSRQSNISEVDQHASSPLEKLQYALQEQARAGQSSSSNEASGSGSGETPGYESSSSGHHSRGQH